MTADPFDALRLPAAPVDPDPTFARDLRARLGRAVLRGSDPVIWQEEETVTVTDTPSSSAAAVALHTLTPYLAVTDARAALGFYVEAFGAVRRGEPIVMPDGRVGHAEVLIGDSVLMLADEFAELDLLAPVARGGPSQSLRLEVADPDAVADRAVAAGGVLERPVTDSPYGRGGVVVDPFGHRWMVSREPVGGTRPGDIGYASLWTRDVAAAERFFTAVMGWTLAAGHDPRSRQVQGLRPLGMWGGQQRTDLFLCYAVEDVDRAVLDVRAAGGTAAEPVDEPYGRLAECVDDQGLPFAVFVPPDGFRSPAAPRDGEITYVDMRVPDATRARAFYGTVLGWRFRPGTRPGYWHPETAAGFPSPMAGLSGGAERAVAVPWFQVADLDAAVAAVRAAGGTASGPEDAGPAGRHATCTDDQGMAFDLVGR